MPALQPVVSVARCVLSGLADGQNIVNVFHVQKLTVGPIFTQAEIDGLANSLGSIMTTRLGPLLATAYSFKQLVCTDLSTNVGVVGVKTLSGAATGGTPSSANSTCACISWKIPRHYRGGHPRTYVGPIASIAVTSGTSLSSSYVTSLGTAATNIIADINGIVGTGSPFRMVCVHRYQNGVTLTPPQTTEVGSAQVDTRIDNQRRRLGKDR